MGKIIIINGSPRASKSNSKEYAKLFKACWRNDTKGYDAINGKHKEIFQEIEGAENLLLVFPLYADGLPVTLMRFLVELENYRLKKRPIIHVLINCGFFEPEQNLVAVDMVKLFCMQNNFHYGSTLCIGAGEAILNTPFQFLVKRYMKKFVLSIKKKEDKTLKVTMPIPKNVFLNASEKYWIRYGKKYGIGKEQMDTNEIEAND